MQTFKYRPNFSVDNEKKLKTLEEKKTDALEMAEEAHEEREEKES